MSKKLVWHTESKKINDLTPWEGNPRKISDKQLVDLRRSLERFNLMSIPVIDTDLRIVSGHQRIKILQMIGRGEETIDVRLPNRKLTEKEYREANLRENANIAEWDFDKLKSFDLGMLTNIGFDKAELEGLWAENLEVSDDTFSVEEELAKIKKPKTKLGDLIILGNHKLLCGDATDPEVLKRLFGDDRASIIYSDPVYNIKIDYNSGIGGKKNYGGNVNDNRTDKEYEDFIRKSLIAGLAVTKDDAHVFYWSDQTYIWLIQTLYRELGIQNKRVCLWIKNGQNPTPGIAFSKAYEPCTYGVRGHPFISKNLQNLNEVMNREMTTGNNLLDETFDHLDIWAVKRLSGKDYTHATSKPPKLHEKAIRRCTRPGDIILDSFSGSASTMIAAEQLKRRVFATELEPAFCDLAIKRYGKLTGRKAKIIRNNKVAAYFLYDR